MASAIRAPGMTARPGKCPWKQGSLAVTFLTPNRISRSALLDAIHHQEGIAMRQAPLDGLDVRIDQRWVQPWNLSFFRPVSRQERDIFVRAP